MSLNTSLPEQVRAFIEEQMASRGFNSVNDYVDHLILQDQERTAQTNVDALLVEGIESGEAVEATDDWWEAKRTHLMEQLHQQPE